VLSFPLDERLAGAGLFTIDGRLVGLVARCPSDLAAIPAHEVERLLAESTSPERRLHDSLGVVAVAFASLDSASRAHLAADSGLFVTAVRRGGPADDAGLGAGDVLISADARTLVRRRGRSVDTLRLTETVAANSGVGIDVTPPSAPRGVPIAAVRAGSAAAAAGLRAGDRLLRVDGTPVASAADARRLLDGRTPPRIIVFERDSVERGVLLGVRP
jgi:S1-C subfamily serine protease